MEPLETRDSLETLVKKPGVEFRSPPWTLHVSMCPVFNETNTLFLFSACPEYFQKRVR